MGEPVWPPKSSAFSFSSYKSPQPGFSFKTSTVDGPFKTNIFQQSTVKETEAFNSPFNPNFRPSGPGFSFNASINAKSCDPNTKSGPGEHAQKTTGVATNTNVEKKTGAFVLENKKNGALGVGVMDPVDAAHKTTKSCDPNTKSGPGEHAQKTTGVATNTNVEKKTGAFVLENKKNGALGVGVLDPVDAAHKTTKSCDPNTKSGPGEHAQKTTGVATNSNVEKKTGAFVLENKKNGALGVGVLDPVDAAHKTTEIATDMEMKKKLETEIAANMKMVYKKNLGCSADDAQKTTEAATKKKVEAAMLENEKNVENGVGVLDPVDDDKLDKKAREARQSPPANSVVVVSRILKGMPQSPHFYQLRDHSECSKTCLKSSWDRIFEDTAEQIQSLQANDFWVRARELWKTMGELQIMGYNVIPLRRRLVELIDVMMEQKLAKSKVKGLKIKAENHRMEKSRLEFVIQHLQEMIRKELQGMDRSLAQAIEMEKDMFKFDDVFAKLAMEPL
ncbi:hypothetical protein Tsubulata_035216 [Turnera subulata]|uniref:Uncharacterized protein n=1 Tax=Turnera subulata TaxID=218843 RepID=A0A9Q0G6M3_9ROSI|nr:hypothetical protein Tsubulata_035216 [Turnera subulata]